MNEFTYEYALYGVTIRSNRVLDGLPPSRGTANVVCVDFAGRVEDDVKATPFWTNQFETLWHLDERNWLLRYRTAREGYCWTLQYSGGENVTIRWDSNAMLPDIPAVLQGPGIAASLHLRDVPLLHACVVAIDGGAVLVIGMPGAGKSTTAAALLRAGCTLVSDDLAAMAIRGDRVFVEAGYPRLRLNADTARAAGWDPSSLPRTFAAPELGDKRFVDVPVDKFVTDACPVRAIYVLLPRRDGGGAPAIAPIQQSAAVPILVRNVYSIRFLDSRRRARSFQDCAAIAARVPVRSVEAGNDLNLLRDLAGAIVEDAKAVAP